jgi:hypothetical protein
VKNQGGGFIVFMASKDSKDQSVVSKTLRQDHLIERLVPDPANHEPVTQLTGWLGKGTEDGMWRLYFTAQLDEYVQFRESDVVHSQPLNASQSSLGGTMVWLKAGTPLEHIQVVKQKVQADFLSGGITRGYMAGSAPSFGITARAMKPLPARTRGILCSVNPNDPCGTNPFYCYQTEACTAAECSADC